MSIRIPDFSPRDYQIPFLSAMDDGCKRAVLVWHRRAGKEITCWNWLIKQAFWHRIGTYVYYFPTSRLGRRILWDGADKNGRRFIDCIPKDIIEGEPNGVEMKIRLKNGSLIQIMGTDTILNVGINPVGCVFSEFSLQDPAAWSLTRPILRENGGWAVFNFTPRGKNHAYDLYNMAKDNSDWYTQKLTVRDTNVLTQEDIDKERNEGMSEHLIEQEFYCSFDQGIEGAYYAKLLDRAEMEGRISRVPYDPAVPVDTYWDLGVADPSVILFVQNCGNEIHLIDTYSNTGEGLQHFVRVLQEKAESGRWVWGNHYAPHDIKARMLAQESHSRWHIAKELGVRFEVVPNLPIIEGIEMARMIWPRLWINKEKCGYFTKCAENYHKKYNETHNVYSETPVHDWSSHCFVGETKILTRNGMQRIMDLQKEGEVLTLCGWKKYQNPRVTRKNANVVEVKFKDNTIVKCTPDHMFLTESGWKFAKDLKKGIRIQSSLTRLLNTSMETSTNYIQTNNTSVDQVKDYIELCGKPLLEKSQKNVISTIEMVILKIINWTILNVWLQANMLPYLVRTGLYIKVSQKKDSQKHVNGMLQMKENYGIRDMLKDQSHGLNGKGKNGFVYGVKKFFHALLGMDQTNKNSAIQIAKLPIIESVKSLNKTEDVWCLDVPEVEHFSLENGSIVHNCMDAFRYLAIMQNKTKRGKMSEEEAMRMQQLYSRKY